MTNRASRVPKDVMRYMAPFDLFVRPTSIPQPPPGVAGLGERGPGYAGQAIAREIREIFRGQAMSEGGAYLPVDTAQAADIGDKRRYYPSPLERDEAAFSIASSGYYDQLRMAKDARRAKATAGRGIARAAGVGSLGVNVGQAQEDARWAAMRAANRRRLAAEAAARQSGKLVMTSSIGVDANTVYRAGSDASATVAADMAARGASYGRSAAAGTAVRARQAAGGYGRARGEAGRMGAGAAASVAATVAAAASTRAATQLAVVMEARQLAMCRVWANQRKRQQAGFSVQVGVNLCMSDPSIMSQDYVTDSERAMAELRGRLSNSALVRADARLGAAAASATGAGYHYSNLSQGIADAIAITTAPGSLGALPVAPQVSAPSGGTTVPSFTYPTGVVTRSTTVSTTFGSKPATLPGIPGVPSASVAKGGAPNTLTLAVAREIARQKALARAQATAAAAAAKAEAAQAASTASDIVTGSRPSITAAAVDRGGRGGSLSPGQRLRRKRKSVARAAAGASLAAAGLDDFQLAVGGDVVRGLMQAIVQRCAQKYHRTPSSAALAAGFKAARTVLASAGLRNITPALYSRAVAAGADAAWAFEQARGTRRRAKTAAGPRCAGYAVYDRKGRITKCITKCADGFILDRARGCVSRTTGAVTGGGVGPSPLCSVGEVMLYESSGARGYCIASEKAGLACPAGSVLTNITSLDGRILTVTCSRVGRTGTGTSEPASPVCPKGKALVRDSSGVVGCGTPICSSGMRPAIYADGHYECVPALSAGSGAGSTPNCSNSQVITLDASGVPTCKDTAQDHADNVGMCGADEVRDNTGTCVKIATFCPDGYLYSPDTGCYNPTTGEVANPPLDGGGLTVGASGGSGGGGGGSYGGEELPVDEDPTVEGGDAPDGTVSVEETEDLVDGALEDLPKVDALIPDVPASIQNLSNWALAAGAIVGAWAIFK